jgi:hypothetical protein
MNFKACLICGGLWAVAGLTLGCQPGDEPGPPRLAPERTQSGAVIAPDSGLNPSAKPMPAKAPADSLDVDRGVQNPLPNTNGATNAPPTTQGASGTSGSQETAPMRPGAGTGTAE